MKFYKLWLLAFLLKFIGSYWDASYHFRYLFEKYSIPHLVNFTGFLLGALLLLTEWRNPKNMDVSSRNLTTIGYVVFLIGIPLDFSYHIAFGIDLTTWSPTHFIYYIATDIMIIGVWRAFTKALQKGTVLPNTAMHAGFGMFLLECLLFPNLQQENGAISYYEYINGHSKASKEILDLISHPSSQIFGGIPEWVYPLYTVLVVSLFTLIVIRLLNNRKIPFLAAVIYLICRFAGKSVFYLVDYPTSYVPISVIFIPLAYMLIKKENWISGLVGSTLYFGVLYGIHQYGWLITPPVNNNEFVPVILLGAITPILLAFLQNRVTTFTIKRKKELSK